MRFRTVVFDCDSTLSRIEGVDALAALRGPEIGERVERWTREAMEGVRPLEDVYRLRFEAIQPTHAEVLALGQRYADSAVANAAEVIEVLRSFGKEVAVVSGGLLPAVLEFARALGIPEGCVDAVPIDFDAQGRFRSVDLAHPLANSGGKTTVLARFAAHRRPICLVGDGVSDLEAANAVERFVGFGGVVRRRAVEDRAAHFVHEPSLRGVLRYCLDEDERARLLDRA